MMRHDRVYRAPAFHSRVAIRAFVFPNKIHTEGDGATVGVRSGPFLKFIPNPDCSVMHLAIQTHQKNILNCPKLNYSGPEDGKEREGVNQLADSGQKPRKDCSHS